MIKKKVKINCIFSSQRLLLCRDEILTDFLRLLQRFVMVKWMREPKQNEDRDACSTYSYMEKKQYVQNYHILIINVNSNNRNRDWP